jgi:hypothetical protein
VEQVLVLHDASANDVDAGLPRQQTAKSPPHLHVSAMSANSDATLPPNATLPPEVISATSTNLLLHVSEIPDTRSLVGQEKLDMEETLDLHSSSSIDIDADVAGEHNTLPTSGMPHTQDESMAHPPK